MTNQSWMDQIDSDLLQDKGYVFMWVTNLMDVPAIDFMRERGYFKIETINWSKLEPSGKHYKRSGGATLLHCNEQCLVFRKTHNRKGELIGDYTNFRTSSHQITTIPDARPSTKPFQLYEIIERMCNTTHGGLLEIFSRPHNQRWGWVSIGNESISFLPPIDIRVYPKANKEKKTKMIKKTNKTKRIVKTPKLKQPK